MATTTKRGTGSSFGRLLGSREAATTLGCSTRWIRQLAHDGRLQPVRLSWCDDLEVEFADRAARNEEIFKAVNREIEVGAERHRVSAPLPFHCECADASCLATLSISVADYERGAGKRYCFLVLPGHQDPRVERVVEEHEDFLVVEKLGEARAEIDRDEGDTPLRPGE